MVLGYCSDGNHNPRGRGFPHNAKEKKRDAGKGQAARRFAGNRREVKLSEVRLLSFVARASLRVQEVRQRREDVGVQEQREVAVDKGKPTGFGLE